MEPITAAALKQLASLLLETAAEKGLASLARSEPLQRAIQATERALTEIEGVSEALNQWCEAESFREFIERVEEGRLPSDKYATESLLTATEFHDPEEGQPLARQVVGTFLAQLNHELLIAPTGMSTHDLREEIRHKSEMHLGEESRDLLKQAVVPGIERISAQLTSLSTEGGDPQLSSVNARIEVARSLAKRGKPTEARRILREVGEQNPELPRETRARILNNLGACSFALGELDDAETEFLAAGDLDGNDAKALSNLAATALLTGRFDLAIERARRSLSLEPAFPAAMSHLLQALHRAGRGPEIAELLEKEEWIRESAVCKSALAHTALQKGEYSEATSLAQEALAASPDDPDILRLTAAVLLESAQKSLKRDPPLQHLIQTETRASIEEAIRHLSRVAELTREGENQSPHSEALVNRGTAKLTLGKPSEAIDDFDKALAAEPGNETATRNKAQALFVLDREEEALNLLEQITDPGLIRDSALTRGACLLILERPAEAGQVATNLLDSNADCEDRIAAYDLALRAHNKLGDVQAAERAAAALRNEFPAHPIALLALASFEKRREDPERALEVLNEALAAAASESERNRVRIQLGDLLGRLDRFAEAAAALRPVVDTQADNTLTHQYLIALYNSGTYGEALQIASSLREAGSQSLLVAEIEAAIYQGIGDLRRAREVLLEIAASHEGQQARRLEAAHLSFRLGENEAAQELTRSLSLEDLAEDPPALMNAARLRNFLGVEDSLAFAYAARRVAFNDPAAHLTLLNLTLARERHPEIDSIDTSVISEETTAELKRGDELLKVTLTRDPNPNAQANERSPDDPLGRKLLGLSVGDEVHLGDPELEAPYEVVEVKTKFEGAIEETFLMFSTWFPDDRSLRRVPFSIEDPSNVVRMLEAQQELGRDALARYEAGQFGVGTLAQLRGQGVVDIWAALVGDAQHQLLCSHGNPEETRDHDELLEERSELVLDITAVLAVALLRIGDAVMAGFDVVTPQAVVDALRQALVEHRIMRGRRGVLSLIDGSLVAREVTEEQEREMEQFIGRALEFAESRATVVPVEGVLELDGREFDKLAKGLDSSLLSAVLVAKHRGGALFADDLWIRTAAADVFGVRGVWTQAVLRNLRQRGLLDEESYHRSVRSLVIHGFTYTSVNADDLLWALSDAEMRLDPAITRLFSILEGPVTAESAVGIGVEVLARLWLLDVEYSIRCLIQDMVLGVLCTGRDTTRVVALVRSAINAQGLLPDGARRSLLHNLELFEATQVLRGR